MAAQIVLGMFFAFHLAILPTFTPPQGEEVCNGSPVDIDDVRWQHSNPGVIIPHRKKKSRKNAKEYAASEPLSTDRIHLS